LAAVAGQRFDFSLLQKLTGQPEAELLSLIKELITAQLVVEESVETFAFRHALTRHAIYAELLARERQAMHRVIAEALEKVYGESSEIHLPDLAHHFHHAGVHKKTMLYAPRMGGRALAMYAPQAAITHFTRAIEAAQALGQPPSPSWHRARAQAHELRGEFEQALRDYECVLDTACRATDHPGEWQSLLDLGFLWLARDYDRAGDFLRGALELARRIDDPQRLAHSLNRLGNWYVNMEQPRRGQNLHQQALAIFEQFDDRRNIADTQDLLGVSTYLQGNRSGAITHFEQADAIYRELNERQGLVSTLATLAHLRSSSRVYDTLSRATHNWEQMLSECEEALAIAREIAWRSGEVYALCEQAACLSAIGEYGRALATAQEGRLIAEEMEHNEWLTIAHCNLGIIYLDLLLPDAALRHCERAHALARETGSHHLIGLSAAFLACIFIQAGELSRAEALLHEIVEPETPVETLTQSVSLMAYGELVLRRGEPDLALEIADRLIAWAERSGGAGVMPRLSTLRGEALAALQRAADAEAELRAAQDEARQQYARPLLWRIQLALGALLQTQARRDEAERAYTAARSTIDELASTLSTEELREQFRSNALASIPVLRSRSPSRALKTHCGGLTAREREVATLIARGYSNREIAEALVVSERTVETHSGHIREKLGLTSRTQVATWAVEQGLVNDLQ
jgi:DNA-binding CsgD family transcriptional regulator